MTGRRPGGGGVTVRLLVASIACASLTVRVSATSAGAQAPEPDREWAGAWIDDPLDATVHPAGPIAVVAHAADPDGLRRVELLADGEVVDDASGGSGLLTLRWSWTPPEPGRHVLVVQAVGDQQVRSDPVVVITAGPPGAAGPVPASTQPTTGSTTTAPGSSTTIVVAPSSSTTIAPTTTTTPQTTAVSTTRPVAPTTTVPLTVAPTTTSRLTPTTTISPPPTTMVAPTTTVTPTTIAVTTTSPPTTSTTTAPTTVPCVVGVPRPVSPDNGASVATLNPVLSWSYDGCPASSFEVVVSRDPGFARVEASGSVTESRWMVQPALQDCTVFYWRVRAYAGRTIGDWSTVFAFSTFAGRC